jgi:adenine-specific DNA glycosylase
VALATGRQAAIPPPRGRGRTVRLRQRAAVIERDGRLLLRRRPATGLMDGFWEVPLLEPVADGGRVGGGRGAAGGAGRLAEGGPRVRLGARVGTVRHTVTWRRIEVEIVKAAVLAEPLGGGYRWVAPKALGRLPVSSLVGKILARAGSRRGGPAGVPAKTARRRSGR